MPRWEQLSRNDYFQTRFCSGLVPGPHVDGRSCVLSELYFDSTRVERRRELQSMNMLDSNPAPSAEPRSELVTAAIVTVSFVSEQAVCAVSELRSRPVNACRLDTDVAGDLGKSGDGRSGSRYELSITRWISFVLHC